MSVPDQLQCGPAGIIEVHREDQNPVLTLRLGPARHLRLGSRREAVQFAQRRADREGDTAVGRVLTDEGDAPDGAPWCRATRLWAGDDDPAGSDDLGCSYRAFQQGLALQVQGGLVLSHARGPASAQDNDAQVRGVRNPVRMQGRVDRGETSWRHADTLGSEPDMPGELSTGPIRHTAGPGRLIDDPALRCGCGAVGSAGGACLQCPDHLIAGLRDCAGQSGLLLPSPVDQRVRRVHGLLRDLGGGEEPDGCGLGHLVRA